MAEDILFSFLACFFAKSYGYIDKILYKYRFGSGISTQTAFSNRHIITTSQSFFVYSFLKKWCVEHDIYDACEARLNVIKLQLFRNISNTLLTRASKKQYAPFASEILKYMTASEFLEMISFVTYNDRHIPFEKLAEVCAELDLFKPTKKEVKTIATFYYRMHNGGVENVLSRLTDIWVKSGYQVVLFTDQPPHPDDYYQNPAITRTVLPPFEAHKPDSIQKRIEAIRTSIEAHHIDMMVYHAWNNHNIIFDSMAVKSMGVPFIVHTHNAFCCDIACPDFYFAYMSTRLHRLYALCDSIIALNESDKAYWSAMGLKCFHTINPIACPLETETSKLTGNNILMVCRISEEKQVLEGVKTFEKVLKKIPDAKLTIVGSGDNGTYMSAVKNYIRDQKLSTSIDMVGFKKNVIPYYQNADVMLITSKYEGAPLVIMESKICGIPLVSYDIPNLDTLRDGRGVLVVPQKDSDSAAEKIVTLLQNPALKKELGKAARQSAEDILSIDLSEHWNYIFKETIATENTHTETPADAAIKTFLHYVTEGIDARSACASTSFSSPIHVESQAQHIFQLEKTVKELRASTSYKLGWFLTWPFRKIKDKIKGQKYVE